MRLTPWIKEFFRKADIVLLALILAASIFGVVLIYSATRYLGASSWRYVPIQLVSIVLGIAAYFVLSFVDGCLCKAPFQIPFYCTKKLLFRQGEGNPPWERQGILGGRRHPPMKIISYDARQSEI